MKTIFDKATRDGLIARIETLDENSTRQWGKMSVYQMLKHCTLWEEMILRNKKYKRVFIGRLFGKMLLKNAIGDDQPMRRNSPTIAPLMVKENAGDVAASKKRWIELIEEYENFQEPTPAFIHPFFGKMTKEQIGYHSYKHTDHHLRQFNS